MTQPEALRLAERIDGWVHQDEMNIEDAMKAADELRRLYKVSDDLRESLNHKSYYQARLTKHMREMKEHMKEMKVQRDELLEFAQEVRRSGDTRLASMAIAVIAKAKEQQ